MYFWNRQFVLVASSTIHSKQINSFPQGLEQSHGTPLQAVTRLGLRSGETSQRNDSTNNPKGKLNLPLTGERVV